MSKQRQYFISYSYAYHGTSGFGQSIVNLDSPIDFIEIAKMIKDFDKKTDNVVILYFKELKKYEIQKDKPNA